jgi:hypothetical protein
VLEIVTGMVLLAGNNQDEVGFGGFVSLQISQPSLGPPGFVCAKY